MVKVEKKSHREIIVYMSIRVLIILFFIALIFVMNYQLNKNDRTIKQLNKDLATFKSLNATDYIESQKHDNVWEQENFDLTWIK